MSESKVTQNFYLSEFVVSDTAVRLGIDNTPSAAIVAVLVNVLIPGMQTVRDLLGKSVIIKSGYRCPALNAAVHGAASSQHLDGCAADFVAPEFGTPQQVAAYLADRTDAVNFDQLIYEGAWVHASFAAKPRNQVMTAHFTPQGVTYTQGLA